MISTSSYKNFETGMYRRCSISFDEGRSAGYTGDCYLDLAPKREFWDVWKANRGKISEEENTRYYVEEYYKQVLSKVNIEELLQDEKDPILLCYEKSNEFCHRHILAEYINLIYGVSVPDVSINDNLEIIVNERPDMIRQILESVVQREREINEGR